MAGFYVHIPFVADERPYDDTFTSSYADADISAFVTALQREIYNHAREYAGDEPLRTIYIGGGRPTLLLPSNLRSVLYSIQEDFGSQQIEETTLEANPADLTVPFLDVLKDMGVTRLSLDVLSFDEDDLDYLNAPHSPTDAVQAITDAREAGFEQLSVELLFGWPEQSDDTWKASVKRAVELGVPHVSVSEWADDASDDDSNMRAARRLRFAMNYLEDNDYTPYEITHFAREGAESKHQIGYYTHANYLGAGPSAHSFWWRGREQNQLPRRWSNVKDVETYVENLADGYSPVSYRQTVDYATLGHEYISLRLRTKKGLNLGHLKTSYNVDLLSSHRDLLQTFKEKGLVDFPEAHRMTLTPDGRLVADGIVERLLRS